MNPLYLNCFMIKPRNRISVLVGLLGLFLLLPMVGCSSSRNTTSRRIPSAKIPTSYNAYIDRYAAIALDNQKRYRIPASITLAQGLLESNAGRSRLAVEANNHFGIKCHNSWRGAKIYHNDDNLNDCFRSYGSPEDSYRDHSEFLRRPRYASLFKLPPTDYKGWAKGLQQCGYATDRGYANKLIKIIEDNRLYLIDRNNPGRHYVYVEGTSNPTQPLKTVKRDALPTGVTKTNSRKEGLPEREYYLSSGLLYVIAFPSDDLARIAHDTGISEKEITKYNELPEGYPLEGGDIIYLQPKLSKAQPPYYQHLVKVGESIHQISQMYGIRVASIYKLNNLSEDYVPKEGDLLKLR